MKARRVWLRLRPPPARMSRSCRRAMHIYSRLWASETRPFGNLWRRLNAELMDTLRTMPPAQQRIYYRHVANVVAIMDPRPKPRNH